MPCPPRRFPFPQGIRPRLIGFPFPQGNHTRRGRVPCGNGNPRDGSHPLLPFPQGTRPRRVWFPGGHGGTPDADGFPAGMETRVMGLTPFCHSRRESVHALLGFHSRRESVHAPPVSIPAGNPVVASLAQHNRLPFSTTSLPGQLSRCTKNDAMALQHALFKGQGRPP